MANIAQDITLDASIFDLVIKNGDFFISDSDQQSAALILRTYIGNWKQFPLVGLGLQQYQAGNISQAALNRIISIALQNDGIKLKSFSSTFNSSGEYDLLMDITRIF